MPLISPLSSPANFDALVPRFRAAEPFHHVVIDNFLSGEVAEAVAKEFPNPVRHG